MCGRTADWNNRRATPSADDEVREVKRRTATNDGGAKTDDWLGSLLLRSVVAVPRSRIDVRALRFPKTRRRVVPGAASHDWRAVPNGWDALPRVKAPPALDTRSSTDQRRFYQV
jgi:hypothetical protein